MVVAEGNADKQLPQEGLDGGLAEIAAAGIDVFFEILIEVLKDEGELLFGVYDVVEPDNIWVLELFEQGDFADGRAWHSFVLTLQTDALQRDDLIGLTVLGLVHDTIGSFAELVDLLVFLQAIRS